MEEYLVGIDFGTCYTKVSYCNLSNKRILRLKIDKQQSNADKKIPTVIYYKSPTEYTVGQRAVNYFILDRDNVVKTIKRKLEVEKWTKYLPALGAEKNAEEVVTDIFAFLKKGIGDNCGNNEIAAVAITVPVCFSELQKGKILAAAKKAGLPIMSVLTEPVAAVLGSVDIVAVAEETNAVLFDWGGATLDLCLCRVGNAENKLKVEVLSSTGLKFGGVDINDLILEEIIKVKYKKEIEEEAKQDPRNRLNDDLLEKVELLKEMLFEDEEESVSTEFVAESGNNWELELTLKEVEEAFDRCKLKEKIQNLLDKLFDEQDEVDCEDVNLVKAIGGTCRISYFRQIIQDYFGDELYDMDDFDEDLAVGCVSEGAARYLLLAKTNGISMENSTPFYLGIAKNDRFKMLIQKNAKYGVMSPVKHISRTELNEQNWEIKLYQDFNSNNAGIYDEDGPVYIGSICIKPELFGDKPIAYRFGVNLEGSIVGEFYTGEKGEEPVLCQTEVIKLGGV